MADQIRRGGLRRPVVRVRDVSPRVVACVAAALVMSVAASTVGAHGSVATLQLSAERINPGGTIEVVGDMTTDGLVSLTLVADLDGAARPIATLTAGDDGHFQAFVTLPGDVPEGSYTITAGNGVDLTRAPVVIAGAPVEVGEGGQLPGQDEPLAGAAASAQAQAGQLPQTRSPAPAGPAQSPDLGQIALVVLLALGLAFVIGAVARRRTTRAAGP